MQPRLLFGLLPGLLNSFPGLEGRSFPGVDTLSARIRVTRRRVKLSGAMRGRVMMKLSSGKEVHPFPRVVSTEDAKICFNLLIGSFCLPIHLRVVCSGEFDIVVEESC